MELAAQFADVVERFDEWFRRSPQSDDALTAHRLLTELQLGMLHLPTVESDDEYIDVHESSNLQAWRTRLSLLPVDFYWKVFDVFAEGEHPVGCMIADDFADIHADLLEGLHFFRLGNDAEAVWRWQFSYFSHWGRHLTGAQNALHQDFADQGGANNLSE